LIIIQRNHISIWNYRYSQLEMAMRGGRREGAGRPLGAKNKLTREVEAAMKAVAEEFAEAVPDAFTGDGVAFLQTVYKDPKLPLAVRMDAAAKAARFERPMLASSNVRVIRRFEDLTDEELAVLANADRQPEAGDDSVHWRRPHRLGLPHA
jgi:hypothetical protein